MSGFGVTETVLVLVWALLLIVPIVLAFVVRDLDMEGRA